MGIKVCAIGTENSRFFFFFFVRDGKILKLLFLHFTQK